MLLLTIGCEALERRESHERVVALSHWNVEAVRQYTHEISSGYSVCIHVDCMPQSGVKQLSACGLDVRRCAVVLPRQPTLLQYLSLYETLTREKREGAVWRPHIIVDGCERSLRSFCAFWGAPQVRTTLLHRLLTRIDMSREPWSILVPMLFAHRAPPVRVAQWIAGVPITDSQLRTMLRRTGYLNPHVLLTVAKTARAMDELAVRGATHTAVARRSGFKSLRTMQHVLRRYAGASARELRDSGMPFHARCDRLDVQLLNSCAS
jgi:AraC-like DNA-binding protein